jgi:hypothetical protein
MGGRRVLEGELTITEVVVLNAQHGSRIGRRTGVVEPPMSMQRTLHRSIITERQ